MKDARVYLRHILECVAAVRGYTADGREAFLRDRKTQKATLRELQELAESTQRLPEAWKALHPEIPWPGISGFRNALVHDYLGLNLERVWEIVVRDLPPLQAAVETLLRDGES